MTELQIRGSSAGSEFERLDGGALVRLGHWPRVHASTPTLDAAVLDAQQRQSLVTIRSLGRAGLRVGAFDVTPRAPAFTSKWCGVAGVLPDYSRDPDEFVAGLVDMLERHSPKVLMVAHDGTIETLRPHRSELERHVAIALPPERALEVTMSKYRTLALAQQLGIDVPRSVEVKAITELPDALLEVGLPAVIKPFTPWVDNGKVRQRVLAQIVVNRAEARDVTAHFLEAGTSILVQEWLSGAREAVWLLYAEGRFWARFVQVAHRMFPLLGGASVLRESIPPPRDIVGPAEQLVAATGLTGYSEVEFRRDARGRPRLMEINPRLSASVELAVRAGIDFPLLLYRWAAHGALTNVSAYRFGVRMRWLGGDLAWLRATLQNQGRPDAAPASSALKAMVVDSVRPAGYDYLKFSDIRPAMIASADFLTTTVPPLLRAAQSRARGHHPARLVWPTMTSRAGRIGE